jgi:hypothetical protein
MLQKGDNSQFSSFIGIFSDDNDFDVIDLSIMSFLLQTIYTMDLTDELI